MVEWTEAVLSAVRRQASKDPEKKFTRQALIQDELGRIVSEVGSVGVTPEQTLSRELQELAEVGQILFVDRRGTYQLIADLYDTDKRDFAARYFIDGFRSLRSFSIRLERGLNVLVGPNGAGKTNFIDFLAFISYVLLDGASSAVSRSGGVSRVFSQENLRKSSPKVSARFSGLGDVSSAYADPEGRHYFKFEYFLEVRFSRSESSIYISSERIRVYSLHSKQESTVSNRLVGTISIQRRSSSAEIEPKVYVSRKLFSTGFRNPLRYARRSLPRTSSPRLISHKSEPGLINSPGPNESLLIPRGRPAFDAIRAAVTRGRVFNIAPDKAREPDQLSEQPVIRSDGSGLSATLYHMQQVKRSPRPQYEYYFNRYGKDTLDTVIEWTKLVLPELSDLSVSADPHSGKYLVFVSVGGPERPLRLSLQALSDGTIKWLAFVSMIVVQGGSYSVEEPENFLHPKMQQSLVDLIRMNLEERNSSEYYIISTHSETLINQVTPSELILFSFSDGLTSCKRVRRPEHIEAEINRTRFGLGHYYASNAVS